MSSDLKTVGMLISPKRKSIYYKYDSCKNLRKKEKKTTLNHMNISQKITLIDNKCVKRYNEWLQQFDTYIIIRSYII